MKTEDLAPGTSESSTVRKVRYGFPLTAGILCLVMPVVWSVPADFSGYLVGGIDCIFVIPAAVFICICVCLLTHWILIKVKRKLTVMQGMSAVAIFSALVTFLVAWDDRRSDERTFINPLPKEFVLHQAHQRLMDLAVHFSAPPESIVAMINKRELTEARLPEDPEERKLTIQKSDSFCIFDWWQPQQMSNPKMYTSGPEHLPWIMVVWVNDKTNEVFANLSH